MRDLIIFVSVAFVFIGLVWVSIRALASPPAPYRDPEILFTKRYTKCYMCDHDIKQPDHTRDGIIHEWCEGNH